jgi:hypothetical protein
MRRREGCVNISRRASEVARAAIKGKTCASTLIGACRSTAARGEQAERARPHGDRARSVQWQPASALQVHWTG